VSFDGGAGSGTILGAGRLRAARPTAVRRVHDGRMTRSLLAVLLGGALGTAARLGVDLLLPHGPGSLALSTLVVNVIGCLALGALTTSLLARPALPEWARAGIGPGLLGGFTTMSAVALVLGQQLQQGLALPAALQGAAQVVLSLLAIWAGLRIGRRIGTGGADVPRADAQGPAS